MVRRRHRRRVRCALIVQRAVRRSRRFFIWQELVYSVLEIAHDAATIVQCWLRRAAAKRLLATLKRDYFRAHYGHDFLLDETANWAAFGMPVLPLEPASDAEKTYAELFALVPVAVTPWSHGDGQEHDSPDAQLRQYGRKMGAPAAGEVISLLDYPAPPPGCLFMPPLFDALPYPVGQASVQTSVGPHVLLSVPVQQTSGVDSVVNRVFGDLPCLSQEGRIRSRALWTAAHPNRCVSNADGTTGQSEPSGGGAASVTASGLSQLARTMLGDLHSQTVEVWAGDLSMLLGAGDSCGRESVPPSSGTAGTNPPPVYAALAAHL
jgi:hypothetical protein